MTTMKMLFIPTFYNIVWSAFTAFLVAVVLSPQESLAFERHEHSTSSSSTSSHTYPPYNDGNVVVRTLLVRGGGGKEGDLNLSDDGNDSHGDHITNIAGSTMDDSLRGGGQYPHRDTSTTASRHSDGFGQRTNNLVGLPRRRRLSNIRSNVNQAYNNYLVRFYWSQVTKGCFLHVPPNNNPSDTDALLAVQVRGGADNNKHNQNKNVNNHVDEFTKGILKILKHKFLMIVATGIVLYTCIPYPAKSPDASPALCIACGILVAEICTGSSNSSE